MNESVLQHSRQALCTQVSVVKFACRDCSGEWLMDLRGTLRTPKFLPAYLHCPWCGISQRTPPDLLLEESDDDG